MLTITILLLLISIPLSSQIVVKDNKTGNPIPFVHIFNSDGHLGAVSDVNGKISLEDIQQLTQTPEADITIQHIVYEPKQISTSTFAKIDEVLLTERAIPLDEIVVTPQSNQYDYVRLKTFFRSYVMQNNEPLYYVDGIASYYIPNKKGKTKIELEQHRVFHNKQLDAHNKLNSFLVDINNTPGLLENIDLMNELNRKYTFREYEDTQHIVKSDSVVGYVYYSPETKQSTVHVDRLAPDDAKAFKFGSLKIEKNRWNGSSKYLSINDDKNMNTIDIQSAKEFYSTIFTQTKKELSVENETLKEVYIIDKSYINKNEIDKKKFMKSSKIPTISKIKNEYWDELNQFNIPPIDPNFERLLGDLLVGANQYSPK